VHTFHHPKELISTFIPNIRHSHHPPSDMDSNQHILAAIQPQLGDSAETFQLKSMLYSSLEREQELAQTVAAQRDELNRLHRLLAQAQYPEGSRNEVDMMAVDMGHMSIGTQWAR
jgi:hypothetical protein